MKMRPSFLAAFAFLAAAGVGFGSAPPPPSAIVSNAGQLKMTTGKSFDVTIDELADIGSGRGFFDTSVRWHKLNQRQIRKNRRRAHAAGKRHAFA